MAKEDVLEVTPCLVTINVDSKVEQDLFHQQRVICGWKADVVPQLFEQMRQQRRTLYWICVPSGSSVDVSKSGTQILSSSTEDTEIFGKDGHIHVPLLSKTRAGTMDAEEAEDGLLPVGHISIDFEDFGSKMTPLLGTSDGRIITISSLFILPYYRKLGLANWAMKECEGLIRSGSTHEVGGTMVKCEIISLSSMSVRHWNVPGPDGMGRWERMGQKPGRYLGDWYKSLGYEWVAEMEKYKATTPDGEVLYWWCEVWHKKI